MYIGWHEVELLLAFILGGFFFPSIIPFHLARFLSKYMDSSDKDEIATAKIIRSLRASRYTPIEGMHLLLKIAGSIGRTAGIGDVHILQVTQPEDKPEAKA